MTSLPRLLVSSVVRGSLQGESHGGLYLVDLEKRESEQVLDWNASGIDRAGRGGDRGLRGIGIVGNDIYLAASDELFVLDPWFRLRAVYRNPYLGNCHELSLHGGKLYLTSTKFDALLRFDLASRQFDLGIAITSNQGAVSADSFDPRQVGGPAPASVFHINNVHADSSGVFVSGRKMPALLQITQDAIGIVAGLPRGTHNARPFRGGVLFNDTDSDSVVWNGPDGRIAIRVPLYDPVFLLNRDAEASGIARQGFARGLCAISDTLVAAGSSPTTIAIHDLAAARCIMSLNLTMDVRHAAHGLAVWPF